VAQEFVEGNKMKGGAIKELRKHQFVRGGGGENGWEF